jgi:hypothetical protein
MSVDAVRDHFRCPAQYCETASLDVDDVIDNLRLERYAKDGQNQSLSTHIARKIYYVLRPFMSVSFRKHLQRRYLKGWQQITFPHWPVDRTVECIFEASVMLGLELRDMKRMPFVWFWPHGHEGSLILTHDVETEIGRDFAPQLADIDASFGFKSSFQIVPEQRYEVSESFLESLRLRGCEINLHGLNHDGNLFESREIFMESVQKINRYARQYGAAGFRSPVLYRNLDWYGEFEFSYDMTVPNCAHLDPQRGGCCTVMPYFIGDVLELPLTTIQDYSLFHLLHENSIDLWKRQIDLILQKHGLISFNVHPDYIIEEPYRSLYRELLDYLATICEKRHVWRALPNEVNDWWRDRQTMSVVEDSHNYIEGFGCERADVAYAHVASGQLHLERSAGSAWRSPIVQAA